MERQTDNVCHGVLIVVMIAVGMEDLFLVCLPTKYCILFNIALMGRGSRHENCTTLGVAKLSAQNTE